MDNKCEGCNESIYGDKVCASQLKSKIKDKETIVYCPCVECLVKGMCTISCDAFTKYCEKLVEIEHRRIHERRSSKGL